MALLSLSSYATVTATVTDEETLYSRPNASTLDGVDLVTVYAGPETVPPNAEIYIDVEILNKKGASFFDGERVTLNEVGQGQGQSQNQGQGKSWTSNTVQGLAKLIIPAGQISGDRVFFAEINGQVSKPVSVFVTTGHIDTVKSIIHYVDVSNDLIVDIGPVSDAFGNLLEDGTLVSLSVKTRSGEMTYENSPLIRGRARWSLSCERYRAGISTIIVRVKNTQKRLNVLEQNCRAIAPKLTGEAS